MGEGEEFGGRGGGRASIWIIYLGAGRVWGKIPHWGSRYGKDPLDHTHPVASPNDSILSSPTQCIQNSIIIRIETYNEAHEELREAITVQEAKKATYVKQHLDKDKSGVWLPLNTWGKYQTTVKEGLYQIYSLWL